MVHLGPFLQKANVQKYIIFVLGTPRGGVGLGEKQQAPAEFG